MHAQAETVQLCKRTAFVCFLSKEYILEINFLTITAWGIKQVQYSTSVLNTVYTQHETCHVANRSLACVFDFINPNATAVENKIDLGKPAEMHTQILCPMVQPFILTE